MCIRVVLRRVPGTNWYPDVFRTLTRGRVPVFLGATTQVMRVPGTRTAHGGVYGHENSIQRGYSACNDLTLTRELTRAESLWIIPNHAATCPRFRAIRHPSSMFLLFRG